MAAAAPPPPNLDAEARLAVARACDALITRQQLFPTFDEKVGAADFARWRKDLVAYVASAGPDFVAALLFPGVIPAPPQYGDQLVNMDTAAGRPQLTMPQMRQQAMLTVIRCTLQPGGESRSWLLWTGWCALMSRMRSTPMAWLDVERGACGGLQSASYPLVFAVVLACAHLGLSPPGVVDSGGSPLVVPTATMRVEEVARF